MSPFSIRPLTPTDIVTFLRMLREFAETQKSLNAVTASEEGLRECFFGAKATAEGLLAEIDGEAVGYAVFFRTNSTYRAKPCLFLEDLYVQEKHRGKGIGKALLLAVVKIGHDEGCVRVDWLAYDWNESAIEFYRSLGAVVRDDIRPFRLDSAAMEALVGVLR